MTMLLERTQRFLVRTADVKVSKEEYLNFVVQFYLCYASSRSDLFSLWSEAERNVKVRSARKSAHVSICHWLR